MPICPPPRVCTLCCTSTGRDRSRTWPIRASIRHSGCKCASGETSSWRTRGGCLCGRFPLSEQHTQARGCPVLPLRATRSEPREAIRYDANAQKRNTETIQIDDMPMVFDVCAVRSCALRCFARTHTHLESLSHSDCLSAFLLPGRRRPLIFSPSSLRSRRVVVVGARRWDKRGQAGRSAGNSLAAC